MSGAELSWGLLLSLQIQRPSAEAAAEMKLGSSLTA